MVHTSSSLLSKHDRVENDSVCASSTLRLGGVVVGAAGTVLRPALCWQRPRPGRQPRFFFHLTSIDTSADRS